MLCMSGVIEAFYTLQLELESLSPNHRNYSRFSVLLLVFAMVCLRCNYVLCQHKTRSNFPSTLPRPQIG